MRHLKMLGLPIVIAAALTSFLGASAASADVLCTEDKNPCPTAKVYDKKTHGKLTFSERKGASLIFETTTGTVLDTCTSSSLAGTMENASEGVPVSGKIEELTFSGCTQTTVVLTPGELLIHNISGTSNGTVTAKGTEITANTIFGISCVYGAGSGVDIGIIKGGAEATMSINAIIPKVSGSGLCPSQVVWTADTVHTTAGGKPLWIIPKSD